MIPSVVGKYFLQLIRCFYLLAQGKPWHFFNWIQMFQCNYLSITITLIDRYFDLLWHWLLTQLCILVMKIEIISRKQILTVVVWRNVLFGKQSFRFLQFERDFIIHIALSFCMEVGSQVYSTKHRLLTANLVTFTKQPKWPIVTIKRVVEHNW